ncbi:hypothetical protein GIB67_021610 [Kingdonia uniflora]|uniref:Uncharacterized protein n=1 Tax=Kingdonia uniflora TaxID=39325 RepID=A0A7J7MDP8_9MAGN|nr:hypothetical protein GIB67_021610 [Kingdonia uniflora]
MLAIIFFIVLGTSLKCTVGAEESFCSAPSSHTTNSISEPLYSKVTNPTLAPHHLQDLPGFTRSVYKRDHALITPESQVFSPLPDWTNTMGAYLITPEMGSHFVMYIAKMQVNSKSTLPPKDVERFLFVVEGSVTMANVFGTSHILLVDSYAYLPANFEHFVKCDTLATLIVFERRYVNLQNHIPEQIVGSTDKQPLLETPGEVFELKKLLPASAPYDFNIHIMDFQPGEYLNVKEVHYNQHGLLLLEGQGIYRLGDHWFAFYICEILEIARFGAGVVTEESKKFDGDGLEMKNYEEMTERDVHHAIDLGGKDGDVLESSRSKSHEEVVTLMREGGVAGDYGGQNSRVRGPIIAEIDGIRDSMCGTNQQIWEENACMPQRQGTRGMGMPQHGAITRGMSHGIGQDVLGTGQSALGIGIVAPGTEQSMSSGGTGMPIEQLARTKDTDRESIDRRVSWTH